MHGISPPTLLQAALHTCDVQLQRQVQPQRPGSSYHRCCHEGELMPLAAHPHQQRGQALSDCASLG